MCFVTCGFFVAMEDGVRQHGSVPAIENRSTSDMTSKEVANGVADSFTDSVRVPKDEMNVS